MSVSALGAFITHESGLSKAPAPPAGPAGPPAVVHRDSVITYTPTEYELDSLRWGRRLNGPGHAASRDHSPVSRAASSTRSMSITPGELESSHPPTPGTAHAVDAIVLSASNPPRNRWRLAAAGVFFFLAGMNDAATGALIPYLEKEYDIGYAIVSLIFISNALGFISMAPIIHSVESRLGRSRSSMIAAGLMTIGYIAIVCTPPFPLVVVSFFFLGSGMALFLAMTNTFIVNLLNGTVVLGVCHGLYGVSKTLGLASVDLYPNTSQLGGIVSPLIATNMVSSGIHWAYFYFITLGLAVVSIFFLGYSFRGFEQEAAVQLFASLQRTASHQASLLGEPTKAQLFKRALKSKTTLLGATFIL